MHDMNFSGARETSQGPINQYIEVVQVMSNDVIKQQILVNYTYTIL